MRVLFVYTSIDVRGASVRGTDGRRYPAMQLGIASISGMLKSRGHTCDLLLITQEDFRAHADEVLRDVSPDVAAFTTVTTQFPHVVEVSKYIRQTHPEVFQICGGPHATLSPQSTLQQAAFDAVCLGEGEYPMVELLERLAAGRGFTDIDNLAFRTDDGQVHINPTRPFTEDLNALPFMDRELYRRYMDPAMQPHSMVTTRGCCFQCTYCCNHAFKKIAAGRYVRSRSVGNVLDEIKQLQTVYPHLDYLYIEDETVGLDRAMWDELLRALRSTGLAFGSNYRIGLTDPDFLDKLHEANFVRLNIGIESGNEWIRENVLKRHYTNEQVVATFRRARALGIDTKAYNLIGLPYETPEHFEDTVRINQQVRPGHSTLNVFFPYPGTELDALCNELGLKNPDRTEPVRERTETVLNLPDFPKERILGYVDTWKHLTAPTPLKRVRARVKLALRKAFTFRPRSHTKSRTP